MPIHLLHIEYMRKGIYTSGKASLWPSKKRISHRAFNKFWKTSMQKHPQTSEVRVRRTVLDASAALPTAERFRWKKRLFWSLSAPLGGRQTSVELLSVCSSLTQPLLFSFHLQDSCCCYSCFICHCYSITPIMITRREWQLRTKLHPILILEWLTHFLAGTNLSFSLGTNPACY